MICMRGKGRLGCSRMRSSIATHLVLAKKREREGKSQGKTGQGPAMAFKGMTL